MLGLVGLALAFFLLGSSGEGEAFLFLEAGIGLDKQIQGEKLILAYHPVRLRPCLSPSLPGF